MRTRVPWQQMWFRALAARIPHKKIQLNILLQKLSNYKHLIEKCDCLVLGCSHFNGVEKNITQKLQQYHFSGKIINTEKILYQFMCKKNIG